MSKASTIKIQGRFVLIEGQGYERLADGSLVPLTGQTDWQRLDSMTDHAASSAARSDPDASPMTDDEWAKADIGHPLKVPVGLKLDDDVLRWFKGQGRGYQTRINRVLRAYYDAHRSRREAG